MRQIINQYAFGGDTVVTELTGSGHIHDTYLLEVYEPSKVRARKILQRINREVFPHPEDVVKNIARVTEHLRERLLESGGDPARGALRLVPAADGRLFCVDERGDYWRVYDYIEGAYCPEGEKSERLLSHCGFAFGNFLYQLADLPPETLFETIAGFHDTGRRVDALRRAIAENPFSRAARVERETSFFLERGEEAHLLGVLLGSGELPVRIVHNDAKPSNLMVDETTGEGVCVIDLDTVMPGSAVYDFGDCIRAGASTAPEDGSGEAFCSMSLFHACAEGFVRGCHGMLTDTELELLPMGAKMMTYECGVRFLTDYLEGDHYFKMERPGQNLDRARTQMSLVADMERKWDTMRRIVGELSGMK